MSAGHVQETKYILKQESIKTGWGQGWNEGHKGSSCRQLFSQANQTSQMFCA